MDYASTFAISASGMSVERLRLDVVAANLANVHSTRAADGTYYAPLQVVSAAKPGATFRAELARADPAQLLGGAEVVEVRRQAVPPRLVHEPGHPDADANGFVAYPGINQVAEMVNLIAAVRAYEANLVALNAAKTLALRTLELGGSS